MRTFSYALAFLLTLFGSYITCLLFFLHGVLPVSSYGLVRSFLVLSTFVLGRGGSVTIGPLIWLYLWDTVSQVYGL